MKLGRTLRYTAGGLVLLAVLALGAGWWIVHRALPQLDGTLALPELSGDVTVDRDQWSVPRIRAASLEDALVAQGYVTAQDRLWQMDVLRRVASGELSEVFGAATLQLDRDARTLGLRQAAERAVASTDTGTRALLEAYARGVNRYIADRSGRLPWEFVALRYEPRAWEPKDSLLIGAYMYQVLTSQWRTELNRAKVTARIGLERARELYVTDSPLDIFVVDGGGAEAESSTIPPRTRRRGEAGLPGPSPMTAPQRLLARWAEELELAAGSNNWVVSGAHTYSGKPLLANDTHLRLEMPCIWYLVHITAPGVTPEAPPWNVKGFSLPGVPLVIVGHNERIAWGFTNNGADVQDLYEETFNPANPREYRVNGQWIAAEVRQETIRVKGRADVTHEVVVTRHGPVVHREENRGYALRWVATEPGGLDNSYFSLGQAQNWDQFLALAQRIPGPAQNTVYADVDGNIGFVVTGRVPLRKNGNGSVPAPGDSDAHEWTGYIPPAEMPHVLNPPGGIIATANSRVVGPNYRWHLTDHWASPHRTVRIYELLGNAKGLRPADSIAMQADVLSLPHLRLAEELARVAERVPPQDARARSLIESLRRWDGYARAGSVEVPFVEYTRRELMRRLLEPHLGEQRNQFTWFRGVDFLAFVLAHRPLDWLPPGYTGFDELLMASVDEAARRLEADTGQDNPSRWKWGPLIELQILHPLGTSSILRGLLSIGPLPQEGTGYTVKQTGQRFGPAMRFVADLADWDNSLMNITTGQSGQLGSSHYRDQFPAWYEARGLASPFKDAAWEQARRHRLVLQPGPRGQ